MKRFTPILSAILVAVMATLAAAQKPAITKVNGPEIFNLEDLRPGMKGTARTVFSGSGTGFLGTATILSDGELVPIPEPSTIFSTLGLLGLVG